MTDFLLLAFTLLVVVNPPSALASIGWPEAKRGRTALMTIAAAVPVFAVAALLAASADDILDWLEIEPESFRIAAGIVFLIEGARVLIFGPYLFTRALNGWLAVAIPLAFPILLTPSLAAAAVNYGADEGAGDTIIAIALGLALTCIAALWAPLDDSSPGRTAASWGGRLLGAILIAISAGLIVDGVRAI